MTNRRAFLQQAGLIAAAITLKPSILCSKPIERKKLGLQLYTLREIIGKDVKGVIAKVAAAGYTEVEVYGYSTERKFWGLSPKEFKQLLKENNLAAPSGHYDFGQFLEGKNDALKPIIQAANELEQVYVTVPWLDAKIRTSADDYKRIAERLNKAAEICSYSNLKLAYHNHDFEFDSFNGTTGYDILLKETDPGMVKMELDLYWASKANQNIHELFNKNKGRFAMWHIKDMDKNDPKLQTEVGSGRIDFKRIFADAELAGVTHYFVEQENFSMDPFQSIRKSAEYVKKNLL